MGTEQAVAGYGQVRLISPYEIHTLTELRIEQNLNEHGRLTARGIIPDDKQDTYIHIPVSHQSIAVQEVNDKGEPGRILFQGLVQEININAVQGIYYLELSAITHSILLDLEPRSRSFAGEDGTYLDMIDTVLAAYDGADKLDNVLDKERPAGMVLQYKETDWAFIRRIASWFGAAIFPEITMASPKLFIGIPEGRYWELLSQPYSIQRDMAGEKELSTSTIHDVHSIDGTTYTVETGQLYKLGDKIEFQGKEFTVIASTGQFQAGHLVYEYRLMPTGKAWQKPLYNIPLIGSSLEGTVVEVKGSEIQVHLSIDGEQRKEVKHWLAYESPYTAEGHGGWYCMPESGDTVQIYFPAATEESAVAVSSRRITPLPAQASSPDIKVLSTPAGKEMKLGTSDFTVSASRGRVYLKLEDQSGVTVQSEEDLLFTSRTNLRGTMNRLTAQAGEAIYMRCGSSTVILDGEADIRGERLRVEGLKKSPVFVEDLPPVPEAPFVGEEAGTQQTAETKNGAKIGVMDTVQLALNVAGAFPGMEFPAGAAKAGTAFVKWQSTGIALAFASVLPFVGWTASVAFKGRALASTGNTRKESFQAAIDAVQRAGLELAGMGIVGKMFTAARGMKSDMTAEEWAERLKREMQPVSYLPYHYADTNMMIREVKKSLNWSDDLTQDVVNAVVERRDTDDTVKAMKEKYGVNVLQGLAYITTSYHAEDAGMSFNELFVDNTYRSSEVPYIGNNSGRDMSLRSGLKKFDVDEKVRFRFPVNLTYSKDYAEHLIEVKGFKGKPSIGIKGGHNRDNFEKYILDNFGDQVKDVNQVIVTETPHSIPGISEIKYKLPVYDGMSTDNGGKGNFTGQWKEYKNPKTVYNPKVLSDEQMVKLGKEAMEEGIQSNRIKIDTRPKAVSDEIFGYAEVDGKKLQFIGYRDKLTGEITNFFPVIPKNQ